MLHNKVSLLYIPLISTEMNCSNKSTMLSLDVFVLHLKQTMLPLDVSLQWHLSINPLPDGPGPIGPRVSKANSSKHKSAEKLLNLPLKKFTWVRLFWNVFRYDYSNLGRFTQLCQNFDLFVCLLIGFSFITMNYNPKKHTSHFIFPLFIPKQITSHKLL